MVVPRFTPSDWQRLEEAFGRANALTSAGRVEFRAGLKDWPAGLRAELEALLAASAAAEAAGTLEQPAVAALGFALPGGGGAQDWVGQVLGGRWRVEASIASGGMGDVLRARRLVGA
jgi:hypothetical protein